MDRKIPGARARRRRGGGGGGGGQGARGGAHAGSRRAGGCRRAGPGWSGAVGRWGGARRAGASRAGCVSKGWLAGAGGRGARVPRLRVRGVDVCLRKGGHRGGPKVARGGWAAPRARGPPRRRTARGDVAARCARDTARCGGRNGRVKSGRQPRPGRRPSRTGRALDWVWVQFRSPSASLVRAGWGEETVGRARRKIFGWSVRRTKGRIGGRFDPGRRRARGTSRRAAAAGAGRVGFGASRGRAVPSPEGPAGPRRRPGPAARAGRRQACGHARPTFTRTPALAACRGAAGHSRRDGGKRTAQRTGVQRGRRGLSDLRSHGARLETAHLHDSPLACQWHVALGWGSWRRQKVWRDASFGGRRRRRPGWGAPRSGGHAAGAVAQRRHHIALPRRRAGLWGRAGESVRRTAFECACRWHAMGPGRQQARRAAAAGRARRGRPPGAHPPASPRARRPAAGSARRPR
jgi:hypothetical protein